MNANIEDCYAKEESLSTKIIKACFNNEPKKVTNLLNIKLKETVIEEIDRNGCLLIAIVNENVTIVEELLKIGCNPNNLQIVKIFVQHNADTNYIDKMMEKSKSPLHYAVLQRHIGMVKELLKHGAEVDSEDNFQYTPLMDALEENQLQIANLLLKYGANINHCCKGGVTALHIASSLGHIETIEFLLENGANISAIDNNKQSTVNTGYY